MEKRDILYLFERPLEPIFYPRGNGEDKVIFEVPADFLEDGYVAQSTLLLNKFNTVNCRKIDLESYATDDIYTINLDDVMTLDRLEPLSVFIPKHQNALAHLVKLFMSFEEFEKFMIFAAYCHDRVNVDLYIHALSIALIHREDTKDLLLPLHWQVFPNKFFDAKILANIVSLSHVLEDSGNREPVEIPIDFTGNNGDPENRVAYWREDIGINSYHWHWHIIYPTDGLMEIVNKDRRGELFYYIHRQIMARYNVERLCNNLSPPERLINWREPIDLAYFSKLTTTNSRQNWGSRPAGLTMQDVERNDEFLSTDIADLERWRNRIYDIIHSKVAINHKGERVKLDDVTGINILTNMVEPNILSINKDYYGSLHAAGHFMLAYIHDPKGYYKESIGVIGSTATAMRDPIFYRWHGFIDDLLLEFKDSLKPYTDDQLIYSGIEVTEVDVYTLSNNGLRGQKEKLNTFWQKTDVDLTRGLDFASTGSVRARLTHLNHNEFLYTIKVDNKSAYKKYGTVRIFMAPITSSNGYPLNFNDQRKLMIEMDKFVVLLEPGENEILRKSTESSLTIPFEQTFRDLNENRPPESDPEALDRFNFCGCGWPQHMLIPKGTSSGFPMQLFVMISDYEHDKVDIEQSPTCKTGIGFCGLKNSRYPDKRSMGYPFDRVALRKVKTLDDFLKPNMKTIPFTITHADIFRQPELLDRLTHGHNAI